MGSGADVTYGIDEGELDKKREELMSRKVLDWKPFFPNFRLNLT